MVRRTIVLLGAGASRDAGLPLTSQLAEMLVARFNRQSPRLPFVQALNFVYSAMIGHQGEDGSDPLRAVNIETLISAVRLLQQRESHEVAPFRLGKPVLLVSEKRRGVQQVATVGL